MSVFPEIILASTSPQRRRILEELEIPFSVLAREVEEITAASPGETVMHNARLKAAAAAERAAPDSFVVAADTVLARRGQIYGKPRDETEARAFLAGFSGESITAWSGLALVHRASSTCLAARENAEILFRPFSKELINWYVGTGEPLTRAGAFGISKRGELLVSGVRGSYSCIAGLPKAALLNLLREAFIRAGRDPVYGLPPAADLLVEKC